MRWHTRGLPILSELILLILLLILAFTLDPFIHSFLSFQPWDWVSTLLLALLILLLLPHYSSIILGLSVLTSILFGLLLKILLNIPRPEAVLPDPGMPSLHSLVAFLALGMHPKPSLPLILLALLILTIRIGTGAHSLSQVVLGSILGWLLGRMFLSARQYG